MILHHPRLPDVTVEVDSKSISDWTDQGWTKTETKAAREAAEQVSESDA